MVGQSVAAYQLRQLPSLSSHGSCSSAFQARRPACRHIKLFAAPACEQHRPQQSPTAAPSRNGAGSAETSSAAAQQFAAVSEGRRSKGWQQRNTADPLPLWGSFIKGIAIFVVTSRAYAAAALKLLGELTYPSPKGIARLTVAVLLSSAALTLIVFSLDQAYMRTLLPPVARRLARM